jgi:hypothetical protein
MTPDQTYITLITLAVMGLLLWGLHHDGDGHS